MPTGKQVTERDRSEYRRRLPIAKLQTVRTDLLPETRRVDREDRPIYCVWELTLACDLGCRHCGSRAGKARPRELNTPEALDLVAQAADLGVKEITLIGGEAYLHPGWTEVISAIRGRGMQCTMVTGGRGFDKGRAAAASAAGVQSVSVSIDGVEATHDWLRRLRGSHDAALTALANCRAAGIPVAINTQLNRRNLVDLPAIFDLLTRYGAHGWQVQLTVPAGRAADEPEVILQPFDLLEAMPVLASLKQRCNSARIRFDVGNNVGYFGPYEHILRGQCGVGHRGACSAGRLTLGVESNGDIKGCPSLPSSAWVGGNIREHSLRDIWERSRALRYMRDQTINDLWGYCAQCYYAEACLGGCTWMASSLFGKPGNNPYCHHRALELQSAGRRERTRPVASAPGRSFDHGLWEIVVEPWDADLNDDAK